MKTFNLIIRIIFGLLFLAIGLFHFYAYQYLAVYVPLPFGSKAFVLLVGAIISGSALALIINKYAYPALTTIAITLAVTAFMVMIPMTLREPDEILKRIELSNLVKVILAFGIFVVLVVIKRKS